MNTQQPAITEKEIDAFVDAITQFSDLGRRLQESRLNEKCILMLLSHITKISNRDVKLVLDALPQLGRTFLKPPMRDQILSKMAEKGKPRA